MKKSYSNFFKEVDKIIDSLIQEKNIKNKIICKKGCTICCESVNLFVFPQEIFLIVNALNKLPFKQRKEIAKKIKNIDKEWDLKVRNKGSKRFNGPLPADLLQEMLYEVRYRCPFLFGNTCIIYENRPTVCRSYFSDNLEACKKESVFYNLIDEVKKSIYKEYPTDNKDIPIIPLLRNIDFKNNKFIVINPDKLRKQI